MKQLLPLLLLASTSALAQSPSFLLFDYDNAEFVNKVVTRFEYQIDSGPFIGFGISASRNDATTLPGHTTRGVNTTAIGLTAGAHTFTIRACRAEGCGPAASPPFAFTFVAAPPALPIAPANLRTLP